MKNTETQYSPFGGPEFGHTKAKGTHEQIPVEKGDLERGFVSEPLMTPEDQGARHELARLRKGYSSPWGRG